MYCSRPVTQCHVGRPSWSLNLFAEKVTAQDWGACVPTSPRSSIPETDLRNNTHNSESGPRNRASDTPIRKLVSFRTSVPYVRMYGFKLEGGWGVNSLKRVFTSRKLDSEFSLPKTKSNLAQQQKNNRLFRRNNQLFILVHKYKLKLKSSRDREIAHTSLYWFTLKPRATSSLPRNH